MVLISGGNGVAPFFLDTHLVTFDQYDDYCLKTGAKKPDDNGWGRGRRPVINVNWFEARAFCAWAGKRLPLSVEYARARRGGTSTKYFWGDDEDMAIDYAWYWANSKKMTQAVGQKKPNQ
jgi:formylglycine-generating enzyme required for sulfatase activity